MVCSYPLVLKDVEFCCHDMISLCTIQDKTACLHLASSHLPPSEDKTSENETSEDGRRRLMSYAILDTFSDGLNGHEQSCLAYPGPASFSAPYALFYTENGCHYLNTRYYTNHDPEQDAQYDALFGPSIAKIIRVEAAGLVEAGDAPAPVQIAGSELKYRTEQYGIYMFSPFVMECREFPTEKVLWKLRLSAYLYTEIEERNGTLYFGTAGKGGRLYGVRSADGRVLFSVPTGGTVHFTWYGPYLLLGSKKEQPVLLDPSDGTIIQKIEFGKFRLTPYQHMLVKNGRLYAAAYAGRTYEPLYLVCADLPDMQSLFLSHGRRPEEA